MLLLLLTNFPAIAMMMIIYDCCNATALLFCAVLAISIGIAPVFLFIVCASVVGLELPYFFSFSFSLSAAAAAALVVALICGRGRVAAGRSFDGPLRRLVGLPPPPCAFISLMMTSTAAAAGQVKWPSALIAPTNRWLAWLAGWLGAVLESFFSFFPFPLEGQWSTPWKREGTPSDGTSAAAGADRRHCRQERKKRKGLGKDK